MRRTLSSKKSISSWINRLTEEDVKNALRRALHWVTDHQHHET